MEGGRSASVPARVDPQRLQGAHEAAQDEQENLRGGHLAVCGRYPGPCGGDDSAQL